jgi:arachidonate 15-lipoxygenase
MGEDDWLNLFPPIPEAQQQLNTLWLLGSIQYGQLGDYRINDWPCQQWFRDPRIIKEGGPLSRFQKSLKLIDREIDRRNSNQQQRPAPYVYLKPSLIPNSINI